ncbi:hypothetical protein LIER_30495 [Lithospermum erythrorhizon]|uniref:Zinc finger, CCHC-type n=1 Tax=Lithospermum erythrorhizon TaxID=34254 RepID=A0AAV3RRI8_LITER
MASEFIALASAWKEVEWLQNLLYELPMWPKLMSPVSLHCDSEATLARAYNMVYNGKSRHIGLRHSYVKQLIHDVVVTLDFVRTYENLGDPLRKVLIMDLVEKTTRGMGLKPV